MLSFKQALRLLLREGDDGKPMAPIDLSPDVSDEQTEIRVVRDGGHIGKASSGDRVRIAKSELNHPAVRRILLTEDEYAELKHNQARRLIQALEPQNSTEGRAAYERHQQTIELRKKREEDERLGRMESDRHRSDVDDARYARMAGVLAEALKK